MGNALWHPIDSANPPFKCLNIARALTFEEFPGANRLRLWDEIYEQTNTPLW
jgi:hypothetical protein